MDRTLSSTIEADTPPLPSVTCPSESPPPRPEARTDLQRHNCRYIIIIILFPDLSFGRLFRRRKRQLVIKNWMLSNLDLLLISSFRSLRDERIRCALPARTLQDWHATPQPQPFLCVTESHGLISSFFVSLLE